MATARGRHCKRPESDFCRWWGRHKPSHLHPLAPTPASHIPTSVCPIPLHHTPYVQLRLTIYSLPPAPAPSLQRRSPHPDPTPEPPPRLLRRRFPARRPPGNFSTSRLFLNSGRAPPPQRLQTPTFPDRYITTSFRGPIVIEDMLDATVLPREMVTHNRRIAHEDLMEALGPVEKRKGVVVYICGPPGMTDGFVEVIGGARGDGSREGVLREVVVREWGSD